MSTIINSGLFENDFFCKKKRSHRNCDCDCDSCNCNQCPPKNNRLCFCNDLIRTLQGQTVTVRGNGGNVYIGTITVVQCDYFTLTVPTPVPTGTTVPAGTYNIPCSSVESIIPGIVG